MRHGVEVRQAVTKPVSSSGYEARQMKTDFNSFWQLLQETNKRDAIRSHTKEHYNKLIEIAGGQLFIAYYQDKPVAGAIAIADPSSSSGQVFYYLHGASTHQYKNVMAPYLLQWEMIKYAKAQGFKNYDFFGVDEKKYPGVTRFKMGFAPNLQPTIYPNAILIPINKFWFFVYSLLK